MPVIGIVDMLKEMDPPPFRGAEVGVYQGRTAIRFLKALPSIRIYYCIDPWKAYPEYHEKKNTDESLETAYQKFLTNIEPYLHRVMVLRMFSREAVAYVKDEALDFVFIDANHEEQWVTEDLELWVPKVRVGGLISGDDWREGEGDRPEWGVGKAVAKFFGEGIIRNNFKWWVWKE